MPWSVDRRRRSGFTLVEMLLVIVIIGILAGSLVVGLSGRANDARITRAQSDISAIQLALDLFEQDIGRYPTADEGLNALVANTTTISGWKGPYMRGGMKPDPWGTPYSYSVDSTGQPVITSAGPDKTMGTPDDITSVVTPTQ